MLAMYLRGIKKRPRYFGDALRLYSLSGNRNNGKGLSQRR